MEEEILISLISVLSAFGTAYYLTKRWIPAAKHFGLVGKDINKYDRPEAAEGGGVAVIIGISVGLFTYLFLKAFFIPPTHLTEIYAVISAVLLAGLLGFADDILGWKKGIRQRRKVMFSAAIVLPIVTLVLLHPEYNTFESWGFPLWFYALLIVPVGIIGASNAINMVAGYNGLEAGMGIIILGTLSFQAFSTGDLWIAYMGIIGIAALAGFLIFNWYPAKVFPGDSLTYPTGAYIAGLVILGNMEILGALLFPLYFIKLVLYLKAKKIDKVGDVDEFGIPDENNHLEMPCKKIYGVAHIAILIQKKIRGYATERGVVVTLYTLQILISVVALIIYRVFLSFSTV